MGRITIFFIIVGLIMVYPIYVLMNQKVIKYSKINKNISLFTIYNGTFNKYDINLSKKGTFSRLDIYKNYYLANELNITNIIKNENYFAKKAKYQKPFLYADFFIYKNSDYILKTIKAKYNSNTKIFEGKKFNLIGKTYKAKGKSFIIYKNKNIKAKYPIFDLKVKE